MGVPGGRGTFGDRRLGGGGRMFHGRSGVLPGRGGVLGPGGGGVLAFARSGGSCPKWALHEAFRTPEGLIPHSFELPDGTRYVSVVKAVTRPGAPGEPPAEESFEHSAAFAWLREHDLPVEG